MRKKQKQRSYSAEFKQEAVRRMAQAKTITGLAEELGIRRKFLYQWRHQFEAEGRAGLERRRGRPPGSKSQNVSPPGPSAAERPSSQPLKPRPVGAVFGGPTSPQQRKIGHIEWNGCPLPAETIIVTFRGARNEMRLLDIFLPFS
jgi:transposase-like protein